MHSAVFLSLFLYVQTDLLFTMPYDTYYCHGEADGLKLIYRSNAILSIVQCNHEK